jgi:hypothetical protein
MSQITNLLRNEDALSLKADVPHEAVEFTDLSELIDRACHIHRNPYETLAALQTQMYHQWLVEAKSPLIRAEPFYRWYLKQPIPKSFTDSL